MLYSRLFIVVYKYAPRYLWCLWNEPGLRENKQDIENTAKEKKRKDIVNETIFCIFCGFCGQILGLQPRPCIRN